MSEKVFLSHANTIDGILTNNGEAISLASVTKITATFGDTTIESIDNENGSITWAKSGYETGEIRLSLGEESIAAGVYCVYLVVYDAINTTGTVWDEIKAVKVLPEVER